MSQVNSVNENMNNIRIVDQKRMLKQSNDSEISSKFTVEERRRRGYNNLTPKDNGSILH